MEKVTLFSHILPEEQERMWVCFQMREIVYENNEIIMEYTNTMKKIGLIAEGQASLYGSDAEGNQYLMDELKKDDVFGEPLLLPEMSQHYYVCAKAKTRVLQLGHHPERRQRCRLGKDPRHDQGPCRKRRPLSSAFRPGDCRCPRKTGHEGRPPHGRQIPRRTENSARKASKSLKIRVHKGAIPN